MTAERTIAQQAGSRAGGLRRAALAPSLPAITQAARNAQWQRYRDQVLTVLPELAGDDAETDRRAALLQRADLVRMSGKAAEARKLKARLRKLEAELDATGLDDAGSDGIDA